MSDQLDIHGNAQPLTWDGEPLYSPSTVAEGLFDPHAFQQMPGQTWLDDQPVAECSVCGRKTWEPQMIGQTCYFPQPDGTTCAGVFVALP